MDHEANTVDEQRILDVLEAAPDYERGLAQLDEAGKGVVKKLREWAGDLAKVAGNKRKRTNFRVCMLQKGSMLTPFICKGLEQRKEPKEKSTQASAPVFTKKENATLA